MNPKAYRLPRHIRPRQYDLRLQLRRTSSDFHGSESILLDITQQSKAVEIHSRGLDISQARLTQAGKTLAGEVSLDADREIATITFSESLAAGEATLDLTFSGSVNKGLVGLYLAQDGPEQLLTTQSFATEARTIFPCFDEPDFKARFSYEITTSAADTVLTNSPLLSVSDEQEGLRTWTFAPTQRMSAYLVAIVIGDIAGTPEETVNGVPIRIWALNGKEHMGRFAHEYTTRLLPWYEDYFAKAYHFDKYDQIAVPGFAAGAMENAGLVTFRQHLLLMNPQTVSWKQQKQIALVVAHEFAHMWFGNLATIKWWDDTWLSEAFAEWLGHKAVGILTPEYDVWEEFQDLKTRALIADALESTHPIYSPVETPAEAMEMFDLISYMKGCSVLRMLESYLGEDAFRHGLRSYIAEFTEGNAAGPDLWRNLQAASDQPVSSIMESWVLHHGYPIIKIALDTEVSGAASLRLIQSRFFSNPNINLPSDEAHLWQIPMVIKYGDGEGAHETRYLFTEREAIVSLPVSGELLWCYANADEVAYLRQDFAPDLLEKLLSNLTHLSRLELMGLLNDQWALTYNGSRSIKQFLNVLSAIAHSTSYIVLEQVVARLHDINNLVEDTDDEAVISGFRAWINSLFADRLAALGYEPLDGESQNDAQQRVSLLEAVGAIAHDKEAFAQATTLAEREADDPASVSPNLATLYINIVAQNGDDARFSRFVDIYSKRKEAGTSPQETNRYLQSFSRFKPPALVARTLGLIDDHTIPQESANSTLQLLLSRKHSQLAAWDYIKSHWEEVKERGSIGLGGLVESTGHLPASVKPDLTAFMEANLQDLAPMSYARALERMDQQTAFRARTRADLAAWFSQ